MNICLDNLRTRRNNTDLMLHKLMRMLVRTYTCTNSHAHIVTTDTLYKCTIQAW